MSRGLSRDAVRSRGTRAASRPHQVLLKWRQVGKALSVNMESGHRSRSPGATCGGLRSRHAPSPPFCEELTSGRWAGECQRSSKAEPLPPTFRRPTLSPLLAIVTSRVLLPPRLHRRTGECKRSTAPRPPRIHLSWNEPGLVLGLRDFPALAACPWRLGA